ncbi:MAG TPA: methylated-DNA--[protein]-cysteine S-methyltransferase [Devosia sp.]|jgi:methylated-DNA-[protein]-cysteine S-methyltransferase|nr:methylated-DNA--[protein]-cysteine S-methyltransferase [Devosia sp.]
MRYALVDTALGTFGLAWTAAGVARVALPGRDRARTEIWISREPAEPGFPEGALADLPERIRRYARGEPEDFSDVPLDLGGVVEFNRRAYAELVRIGYGETTTYGALARTLGDVTLSRAVGQAMGQNPIPLIVPCHRVLGADGKAGGFSSPGGVSAKMRMLALEHAASPTGQYAFGF